jgi:hypothetical protein
VKSGEGAECAGPKLILEDPKAVQPHQGGKLGMVGTPILTDNDGSFDGEGIENGDQIAGNTQGRIEVGVIRREALPVSPHVKRRRPVAVSATA